MAGTLVVAVFLLAASGCHREAGPLDGYVKYNDFLKSLRPHPVRMYQENLNTVVVQGITNGVEYGKYIRPLISSYMRLDGDGGFRFFTPKGTDVVDLGDGNGLAYVCDYQRSQQESAANRSQPVRPETNPPSAAAGFDR